MIIEVSINSCWEKAMKYYLNNAYSQNICGKELMILDNLTVQINNYLIESQLSGFCPWKINSREYYVSQITSPGKYSEMSRLYSYGCNKVNQYEYLINAIKKRKNIKPIVIQIFDPYKDNRDNIPTPCISNIVVSTNNGVVNMYVSYTTMNLFRIGLLDYHQMAFLHQQIARDSLKKVGYLRIFVAQVYMPVFDYYISKQIFSEAK